MKLLLPPARVHLLASVLLLVGVLLLPQAHAALIASYDFENDVTDGTNSYDFTNNGLDFENGDVPSFGISGDGGSYSIYAGATSDDAAWETDSWDNTFFPHNDGWTVAFWVKFDSYSANRDYILSGYPGGGGSYIRIAQGIAAASTGEIEFFVQDGTGANDQSVSDVLAKNSWHHIVLTYNGGDSLLRMYINGTLVNTSDGDTYTNDFGLDVGGQYHHLLDTSNGAANKPIDGNLDELHIYDTALSASEAENLYNYGDIAGAGTTITTEFISPVANDHFNNASTAIDLAYNYSDSGVDASNVDCTLWVDTVALGGYVNVSEDGSPTANTTEVFSGLSYFANETTYEWYVSCSDGTTEGNSTAYNFTTDRTNPDIDYGGDDTTGYTNGTEMTLTVGADTLTINRTFNDSFLYYWTVNITNATDLIYAWNASTILANETDSYYNDSISLETLSHDNYTITVEVTDDHTASWWDTGMETVISQTSNSITFLTPEGSECTIEAAEANLKGLTWAKLQDRYTWSFEKNSAKTEHGIDIKCDKPMHYRGNLYPFPTWVVGGRNWLDLNVGDASYAVTEHDVDHWTVTITTNSPQSKLDFESIGGLNSQIEDTTFFANRRPRQVENITNSTGWNAVVQKWDVEICWDEVTGQTHTNITVSGSLTNDTLIAAGGTACYNSTYDDSGSYTFTLHALNQTIVNETTSSENVLTLTFATFYGATVTSLYDNTTFFAGVDVDFANLSGGSWNIYDTNTTTGAGQALTTWTTEPGGDNGILIDNFASGGHQWYPWEFVTRVTNNTYVTKWMAPFVLTIDEVRDNNFGLVNTTWGNMTIGTTYTPITNTTPLILVSGANTLTYEHSTAWYAHEQSYTPSTVYIGDPSLNESTALWEDTNISGIKNAWFQFVTNLNNLDVTQDVDCLLPSGADLEIAGDGFSVVEEAENGTITCGVGASYSNFAFEYNWSNNDASPLNMTINVTQYGLYMVFDQNNVQGQLIARFPYEDFNYTTWNFNTTDNGTFSYYLLDSQSVPPGEVTIFFNKNPNCDQAEDGGWELCSRQYYEYVSEYYSAEVIPDMPFEVFTHYNGTANKSVSWCYLNVNVVDNSNNPVQGSRVRMWYGNATDTASGIWQIAGQRLSKADGTVTFDVPRNISLRVGVTHDEYKETYPVTFLTDEECNKEGDEALTFTLSRLLTPDSVRTLIYFPQYYNNLTTRIGIALANVDQEHVSYMVENAQNRIYQKVDWDDTGIAQIVLDSDEYIGAGYDYVMGDNISIVFYECPVRDSLGNRIKRTILKLFTYVGNEESLIGPYHIQRETYISDVCTREWNITIPYEDYDTTDIGDSLDADAFGPVWKVIILLALIMIAGISTRMFGAPEDGQIAAGVNVFMFGSFVLLALQQTWILPVCVAALVYFIVVQIAKAMEAV